jgi:CRISPR-associated endonuclease/helicase Cas3
VFVFEAENPPRMPWIRRCASRAAETLRALPEADPLGLEAMHRYFELLYDVEDPDKKQIMDLLNPKQLTGELILPFREAAQAFRFIEEDTVGVIVALDAEARELVHELRHTPYPRATLRKLQQYTVAVRSREFAALQGAGALEMVLRDFPLLCNDSAYSEDVGLCVDGSEVREPRELIL